MTTLTIQIPEKDKDVLLKVLEKFNAKIVTDDSKKEKLMQGIAQGLKEVKEMHEGSRKPLTLSDI